MNWGFKRTTAPVIEPVTATEAKLQCRVTNTAEAALFTDLIATARDLIEQYCSRGLLTQAWQLVEDEFAEEINLPMAAPLQSVASVKYYDTAGVQQTLDTSLYLVDDVSEPARIVLKPKQWWPALQPQRQMAVEINYVVGWTAAALLPPAIKQGNQVLIAALYKNRDATIETAGAAALLAPFRVSWRAPQCASYW